jgi:hypothetical protein
MTALMANDQFAIAKSQSLWVIDPTRHQAAIAAYTDEIEQRRVLADELQPGNLDAQLALASAYYQRERTNYDLLYPKLAGGHSELQLDSDQFLADAAALHKALTQTLANDSGATRLQRLEAWQLLLQSLNREWGWQEFYLQDQAQAATLADQFKNAALQAVAEVEASPLTDSDQQSVAAQIYLMRQLEAQIIENDTAAAAAAQAKFQQLYAQSNGSEQAGTAHAQTLCGEERERVAGQAAAGKGDWAGAQQHDEAALALNPQHVPSLRDLSYARYKQGDVAGAIANAQQATQLAPNDITAWTQLAFYGTAANDAATRDAAWRQVITLATQLPTDERMARLAAGVADLDVLAQQAPHAASALAVVAPFEAAITALPDDAHATHQYPQLLSNLARVALLAGDAPTAERLARASLATDPHQPAAEARLALAVLAQGHDASAAIAAATAEVKDPLWESSSITASDIVKAMTDEVSAYLQRFPDAAASVQPLQSALDGAGG